MKGALKVRDGLQEKFEEAVRERNELREQLEEQTALVKELREKDGETEEKWRGKVAVLEKQVVEMEQRLQESESGMKRF